MNITPKYWELEKESKIIRFIQFLALLTRLLCVFYLVQSKDRLMTLNEDTDSDVGI